MLIRHIKKRVYITFSSSLLLSNFEVVGEFKERNF